MKRSFSSASATRVTSRPSAWGALVAESEAGFTAVVMV